MKEVPAQCALRTKTIMASRGNGFDLAAVHKKKMTLYIGIQPDKLAFSRLINVNAGELAPALDDQARPANSVRSA